MRPTISLLVLTCLIVLCLPLQAAAQGNLRYTVSVTEFENQAGWYGHFNIGNAWGTVLTDLLNQSGRFIVLGESDMRSAAMDEQDFAASGRTAGGKKAPATGQMTPAQLLVKGAITHVQSSTSGGKGGLSFKGISLGGSKDAAEINATIYLVNSETGQVKASTKVVGKSNRKGLAVGYSGSSLGGLTGGLEGFKKDNVGKATEDAVAQAVQFLVEQLEDIAWEGSISLVKSDKIIMNRGSREGVSVGSKFNVGGIEELVDEDTGEVLDSEMTTVATVEVTKVKEKIAYLKVISGGKIEKGMSVFPLQ